ncbi:MAG: HprK-related kinase A [Magnetococcales bacterium]|nr:HprK-related kinase A [Magnetococcales bacterium]
MRICDLTPDELARRLLKTGVRWRAGPFVTRLHSEPRDFSDLFHRLYGAHRLVEADSSEVTDFHIALRRGRGVRRWWRPQIFFDLDGPTELAPFPLDHALPLFEWGFNYGIARRSNQYLMLHSAVVARGERAVILPGLPGSGKSTLCAALVARGWRLFSDEFALVRPETGLLHPLPRPIALKNDSIDIIRAFHPEAVIGPVFPKTRKGNVAHMQPPAASVYAEAETARPTWVITPRFQPQAPAELDPVPLDHGFMRLAAHSFNYELMGARGFATVARLTRSCRFFELTYGDLAEAVALLDDHTAQHEEAPP